MKKIRIISAGLVITISLLFIFCNKKDNPAASPQKASGSNASSSGNSQARTLEEIKLPTDANAALTRILGDVQNSEYVVAVIANPNYGSYCATCASDTYLNGGTNPDDHISIKINSTTYYPDASGQWMTPSADWSALYNSNVDVAIYSGSTLLSSSSIHVPKPSLAAKLGTDGRIDKSGNTLTWTADSNNPSGYVVLYYFLYDADGNVIDEDGELLDDDGSFSLDGILAGTSAKSIYFQLITGNTISTSVNGEKLLFYIESADQHTYDIN